MNKSVYLLLGPEEGEKDEFINRFIKDISKEIGEQPEIMRYYPFETNLVDLFALLSNGTLFSKYRIVLLKNAEQIVKAKDIDLLANYCEHPSPQSSLLLLSDEIGRMNKRIEKLIPANNRKIFWELFENQKKGWIVNFFKKKGADIDEKGAGFLLDMVENNTKQLRNICEKLALFFGSGARIEYEDIEKIIYHSKDENVFTLFERISQRDFKASCEVLHKMLLSREAEPVQLLGGLLYQFRRLKALLLLLEDSYSNNEAFNRLNMRSKRLQRVYQQGIKQYSLDELENIIMLIACFDVRLRSVNAGLHHELLQLFLYYAVIGGGKGAWTKHSFKL